MTREEAREAAQVMLAYADGKEVEILKGDKWLSYPNGQTPAFQWDLHTYRIKPELKYRSFKDADECWQEMQKHQPFGWIAKGMKLYAVKAIECNTVFIDDGCENRALIGYFNDSFTFADGTPFGMKGK